MQVTIRQETEQWERDKPQQATTGGPMRSIGETGPRRIEVLHASDASDRISLDSRVL